MEQFLAPLQEAFGYAGGLVILAVTYAYWSERSALRDSQEKRITENREHSKELFETTSLMREIKMLLEAKS